MSSLESWTQDDELQLAAMLHRKTEVVNKRRKVLKALVDRFDLSKMDLQDENEVITDNLIEHADAITNALKPFTRREVGHAVKFELPKLEASNGQN
jgi:phosphoribosylpyrophosphate synthetase